MFDLIGNKTGIWMIGQMAIYLREDHEIQNSPHCEPNQYITLTLEGSDIKGKEAKD
jgi:hypothetical protein